MLIAYDPFICRRCEWALFVPKKHSTDGIVRVGFSCSHPDVLYGGCSACKYFRPMNEEWENYTIANIIIHEPVEIYEAYSNV